MAQNGQKRIIFIIVSQVRMKVKEQGKQGKKHENGCVKGKHTNVYPYIHTPMDTEPYIHTDTHMHIYTLYII